MPRKTYTFEMTTTIAPSQPGDRERRERVLDDLAREVALRLVAKANAAAQNAEAKKENPNA